jgi:ATP-dependent Clp protease protease subunit
MSKKLLQLLARNRQVALKGEQQRGFSIVKAEASNEATVYIYDAIVSDQFEAEYWGGICPQNFVPEFMAIEAATIHVHINSPGGDVFAGQTIASAFRNHKAKIIAHIDGICASVATVIACACDEVVMAKGAMYMIHNSWTIALGDRNDLREQATLMEQIDGNMADQYAARTGMKATDCAALMDAETWMNAEDAVAKKFADRIDEGKQADASWDLSAYAHAPKALEKPAPKTTPAPAPAASADDQYASEERRERLGQRVRLAALLAPTAHAPLAQ